MSRRRVDQRTRPGFSLIEVLIAIALMLALVGAMFGFFWDLLETRRHVLEEITRRRAVDTMIDRLERDLMTALVGDRRFGAGVAGDERSIRVLCRAVPARLATQGAPGLGDLERAEYRFDENGHGLSARRTLVRAIDEDPADWFELGGPLHRVRFRFHDGSGWRDAFDSLRDEGLPAAVEVAVWFDRAPGEMPEDDFDESGMNFASGDRSTFDATAGFDERAFAMESDFDQFDEAPPDRIRVISVPDGGPVEASTGSEELARGPDRAGDRGPTRTLDRAATPASIGSRWSATIVAGLLFVGGAVPLGRVGRGHLGRLARGRSRRAFVTVAVLVIVTSALLVATSLLFIMQAHLVTAAGGEDRQTRRMLAWSGLQAVMVDLNEQRDRILAGDVPELPQEYVLYEDDRVQGIVRFLTVGVTGGRLVPEAGRLDLNTADAAALVATELVEEPLARAIIEHRDSALGGSYQSTAELLQVPGVRPELVYGALDEITPMDEAEERESDLAERVSDRLEGATPRGLADVVTVYAVEPALQRNGVRRINLNVEWSDELGERLDDRFGEGSSSTVKQLMDGGTSFDSDARIFQVLRQLQVAPDQWADIIDALTTVDGLHLHGRLDINTAPFESLVTLPGIGEDEASQIVRTRDALPAEDRATVAWPAIQGIVPAEAYDDLADRITTRSWTYRVRLAASERPLDDAENGRGDGGRAFASAPIIYEAVIDLADPEPRIAYLRDITALQTSAILAHVAAFNADEEESMDDRFDSAEASAGSAADFDPIAADTAEDVAADAGDADDDWMFDDIGGNDADEDAGWDLAPDDKNGLSGDLFDDEQGETAPSRGGGTAADRPRPRSGRVGRWRPGDRG